MRSSGTSMPAARAAPFGREAPRARQADPGGPPAWPARSSRRARRTGRAPASAAGSMAKKAWPMRGRLPCSEKNESASGPIAAPVSEAQMKPEHEREHRPFRAADRKQAPVLDRFLRFLVVGLPCRSSAQPSGMRSPLRIAIMILPRTTVVRARSIHDRIRILSRERGSHGIGAEERLLPAPGRDRGRRVGEGESGEAAPARPGSQVDPQDADVRAVADAREGDAVAPRALDRFAPPPIPPRRTAGRRGCRSGRRRHGRSP